MPGNVKEFPPMVHSRLNVLTTDDHPQYLLEDGSRDLTGNMAVDALVTIDGVDISVHDADVDAHHAQVYGIADHTDRTCHDFLEADRWQLVGGTPEKVAIGATSTTTQAWALDDTADERIGTNWYIPHGWVSNLTFTMVYAMAGANTTDDVLMQLELGAFADGEDITGAATTKSPLITVPDAANERDSAAFAVYAAGLAADDFIRLNLRRVGSSVADTAAGDLHFIGMKVAWTGDQ